MHRRPSRLTDNILTFEDYCRQEGIVYPPRDVGEQMSARRARKEWEDTLEIISSHRPPNEYMGPYDNRHKRIGSRANFGDNRVWEEVPRRKRYNHNPELDYFITRVTIWIAFFLIVFIILKQI